MSELSVLVISCDQYADTWPVFFSLFWKYWPDCPYPVYLGTNQKQFSCPNVEAIMVGPDAGWARGAQRMVEALDSNYVLILLEDFFFTRPVDTKRVDSLYSALAELEGGYLRLKPFPRPDHVVPSHPNLGRIEPGAPYRVALQAAIWKKDIFLQLLEHDETPWQMELRGTVRSEHLPEAFYSVWETAIYYLAGVTLGKWTPSAVRQLQRENITPDFSIRPMMTTGEALRREYSRGVTRIVNSIPWKFRRRIGNFLRKNGLLSQRVG